jgi:hypothetical protein
MISKIRPGSQAQSGPMNQDYFISSTRQNICGLPTAVTTYVCEAGGGLGNGGLKMKVKVLVEIDGDYSPELLLEYVEDALAMAAQQAADRALDGDADALTGVAAKAVLA